MSDLEDFRKDVQRFLDEHLPEDMRVGNRHDLPEENLQKWYSALAGKGWLTPEWPVEYGGGGLGPAQCKILRSELRAAWAPTEAGVGITLLGPALLDFGTEKQKQEHLPHIANASRLWCQGFSEPGAGSDLAGLRLSAQLVGDEYIVNGSKIWTSGADKADWIFCLVRTDTYAPKHQGISMLLIDMNQPGIEVSPIELIDGTAHFCQVFFDNAKSRSDQIVGPLNGGWNVAKRILQYERGTERNDEIAGELDKTVVQLVMEEQGLEDGKLSDSVLRERLAAHEIDERALDLTMGRAVQEMKAEQQARNIASIGKMRWAKMKKEGTDIAMDALGSAGLGWEGEGFSQSQLDFTREWLFTRAHSIWGGTDEIQKNLIAKRVLNIPEN